MVILDSMGKIAPIGVPGELCISGAGLARGYYKNQALAAQSFPQNPFCGDTKERLYRTGDRARYLANERFDLLGRADAQIKLRGFRVELGDVEEALRRISGRPEVAAALHGGDLVGYVAAADGAIGPIMELRARLRQELPDYMVPAQIVQLDALPRTQNGKLDRKALPLPQSTRGERVIVAPRTPVETKLAALWANVLRAGEVGIHDNLFALGADSIDMFRIAARMRELGFNLDASDLMRHPTIAELAIAADKQPEDQRLAANAGVPSLQSFRRRAGRSPA
jgi:aryl carrier-like protein